MGRFIDLTGKRIGRLVITGRAGNRGEQTFWRCVCDCGNAIETNSILLREGRTKSCGCFRREISKELMTKIALGLSKDLLGQRFGRLLVIDKTDKKTGGHRLWMCRCDCGREKLVQARFMIEGSAVSCGCYGREQQIKAMRARSRGITSILRLARGQKLSTQWREDVFRRDNFTCRDCGVRSGCGKTVVLNADHVKPLATIIFEKNVKTIEDLMACKEIWDINNGRTLCVDCHKKTPTFGGRMHGIIASNFFVKI